MGKKIVDVIGEKTYGINGFHIKAKEDVKNHVMNKETKEKLYNELNNLFDMLYEGEAKEYLRDLIHKIHYDQL